ncbi:putative vRR-NUC domain protein [Bacteroides fragilis str. S24L15]|nr:putative vRR-NUC domain protein [Bacteroides fragilis str. S24L15]EYA75735.1 putative vRR-NUC domain protein [Bacteroides fragilis str. S24L26]EYA80640.1 putative vRR-NUC domain protein [Bacteroides fragilis str. S24L34]
MNGLGTHFPMLPDYCLLYPMVVRELRKVVLCGNMKAQLPELPI